MANLSAGGTFAIRPIHEAIINLEVFEDLEKLDAFLREKRFGLAGIDILNGQSITEVNVSNVSVFKNFIQETGRNFIMDE